MTYRPDVDGLRALAIIVVVAFHTGVPGVQGGFIGVDVFFVISGFLITSILQKELSRDGQISWRRFYARRIRRLIPALVVVVVGTLILGALFLVPYPELRLLGQSAAAVSLFLSNVFFNLKTGGYFGAESDLQPLLNTWSLAVEEQFYLVWPIVLVLSSRLARRAGRFGPWVVGTTISVLIVVSFVAAEVVLPVNQSDVFYLMPFRLWELAAGALLAVVAHRIPDLSQYMAAGAGAVGIGLIAFSTFTIGPDTAFPGHTAVPSVLGTVLVIVAGSSAINNPVSALLSRPPLVWIGTLSYSWYLIHWPLLVFARIITLKSDLPRDIAISLISLFLGWLSYKFVERPFRSQDWSWLRGNRTTLIAGCSILVVLATIGLGISVNASRVSRVDVPPAVSQALNETRTAYDACPTAFDCSFGTTDSKSLLLIGDSHALGMLPIARDVATSLGLTLKVLWAHGCPFVAVDVEPLTRNTFTKECISENKVRLQWIEDHSDDIGGVLMAAQSSPLVYTTDDKLIPGAAEQWGTAVGLTVSKLSELNLRTFYVLDNPVFKYDVPTCLIRLPGQCDMSADDALAYRQPTATAELRALAGNDRVEAFDPFGTLCNDTICFAQRGNDVLYRDRHHLSSSGVRLLDTVMARRMVEFYRTAGSN